MIFKDNVLFVSFSSKRGGAAKAALRMLKCSRLAGYNAKMVVSQKLEGSDIVFSPNRFYYFIGFVVRLFGFIPNILFFSKNKVKHSANMFSSPFVKEKIKNTKSIIHLHWFNNDTLSIAELKKIISSKRVVITLHDEWLYCGAEHYSSSFFSKDQRFLSGYNNKAEFECGINLNRYVWSKKLHLFDDISSCIITTPSSWLKERAEKSVILRNTIIRVVHNPIPNIFFDDSTPDLRDKLKISPNNFVISFGAVDALSNPIKGADLLFKSLDIFFSKLNQYEIRNTVILIFGADHCSFKFNGVRIICLGNIESEFMMSKIYRTSDVTIVPSRVESFGQVAAESLACGVPVVAFNTSGLIDIIDHKKNGYLARTFDPSDIANGIRWLLSTSEIMKSEIKSNCSSKAKKAFSQEKIAKDLEQIYTEVNLGKMK